MCKELIDIIDRLVPNKYILSFNKSINNSHWRQTDLEVQVIRIDTFTDTDDPLISMIDSIKNKYEYIQNNTVTIDKGSMIFNINCQIKGELYNFLSIAPANINTIKATNILNNMRISSLNDNLKEAMIKLWRVMKNPNNSTETSIDVISRAIIMMENNHPNIAPKPTKRYRRRR